jgi:hypothetical protein
MSVAELSKAKKSGPIVGPSLLLKRHQHHVHQVGGNCGWNAGDDGISMRDGVWRKPKSEPIRSENVRTIRRRGVLVNGFCFSAFGDSTARCTWCARLILVQKRRIRISCISGHVDTGQRKTKDCSTKHDKEKVTTPRGDVHSR